MSAADPAWVTGFLSSLLIDYLEEREPHAAKALPYDTLFVGTALAPRAADARTLLSDPNQWIPQEILSRLITLAEDVTGEADVIYLAALAHFTRPNRRGPSIFEIIATLFDDVRGVVLAAGRWATAYTTNVALQTIEPPGGSEAIMLAQVPPKIHPYRALGLFLRGQCEGLPALFGHDDRGTFREEFSQVGLSNLLWEFDDYELDDHGDGLGIINRTTGAVVATAEPVALGVETMPVDEQLPATEGGIVLPHGGDYTLFTGVGASPTLRATANAYRIVQGGRLQRGRVAFELRRGDIYGAPYSRFRFRWPQIRPGTIEAASRLRTVSRLLFTHLHELKQTNRRLLRSERDNASLREENAQLRSDLSERHRFSDLIAISPSMRTLCATLERVVESDATVLLHGETGTGKEVIARALHYSGPRKAHRFIAVNCSALPEGLLESELFGHERGAFTGAVQRRVGKFEAAHGGTLFLDEVGEISPALQVKLLRVLQERTICRVGADEDIPVNIRVIAATHRRLSELVKTGSFRQDLFYRLNVLPITIPPLRDRREDLPLLAQVLLDKVGARTGRPATRFSPDALHVLMDHRWPGNVRELENVIERTAILAGDASLITGSHLPAEWFGERSDAAPLSGDPWTMIGRMDWSPFSRFFDEGGSFDDLLRRIEWAITERAVREHQGNKSHAARTLKRSYRWLRKLEKESLDQPGHTDA